MIDGMEGAMEGGAGGREGGVEEKEGVTGGREGGAGGRDDGFGGICGFCSGKFFPAIKQAAEEREGVEEAEEEMGVEDRGGVVYVIPRLCDWFPITVPGWF